MLQPRLWRRRFLKEMQESNVHSVVVRDLGGKYSGASLKKATDLGFPLVQHETKPFPQVRVLRVGYDKLVSDSYEVGEMPDWFHVEGPRVSPPSTNEAGPGEGGLNVGGYESDE